MTQNQFNTESRKDKHLSCKKRVVIQEKKRDGWSNRDIPKYLGRAPQTINNEINCERPFKFNQCADFIAFADAKIQGKKTGHQRHRLCTHATITYFGSVAKI